MVNYLLPVLFMRLLGPPSICPRANPEFPVRDVVFENVVSLPSGDLQKIAAKTGAAYQLDGATAEVRLAYERYGYFNVKVTEKVVSVPGDEAHRYDVFVRVDNEGRRYRLGDLTFHNAIAFSKTRLRSLFPIQRGEVFEWDKIDQGIDELVGLYDGEGYLASYAVPNTELNDNTGIVNLQINVVEGERFGAMFTGTPEMKTSSLDELEPSPSIILNQSALKARPITFDSAVRRTEFNVFKFEEPGRRQGLFFFRMEGICSTPQYTCEFNDSREVCHRKVP